MLAPAQTPEIQHRFLQINGLKMHVAEAGAGPLVILCHGFPELWYSYRHMLPALAKAGYHAVAPDMRGYGQSDAPPNIEDYSQLQMVGDMVGLIHALGEQQAILIGHDWGSPVAFHTAILRPDLVRAVVLLSVPFLMKAEQGAVKPSEATRRRMPPGMVFYHTYFHQPGVAEEDLEIDVRRTMRSLLYSASGSIPQEHKWRYVMTQHETILDTVTDPPQLPAWLNEADVDYYTTEFTRTGFRGGLSWYRAFDLFWHQTPWLVGRKLDQPTLFIAGTDDAVLEFARAGVDNLEHSVPLLWRKVLLPGVGHWTQQEAPGEVNRHTLEFLEYLNRR